MPAALICFQQPACGQSAQQRLSLYQLQIIQMMADQPLGIFYPPFSGGVFEYGLLQGKGSGHGFDYKWRIEVGGRVRRR
jgi:hypothetical protein